LTHTHHTPQVSRGYGAATAVSVAPLVSLCGDHFDHGTAQTPDILGRPWRPWLDSNFISTIPGLIKKKQDKDMI